MAKSKRAHKIVPMATKSQKYRKKIWQRAHTLKVNEGVQEFDKAFRKHYELLNDLQWGTPFFFDFSKYISYTNGGFRDDRGHKRYVRKYKKTIRTRIFGKYDTIQRVDNKNVRLFVQESKGSSPLDLGAAALIKQIMHAWWLMIAKGDIKMSFLVSMPNAPAQDFHVDHKSDIATFNDSEYLLTKTKTKTKNRKFYSLKPSYETFVRSIHFSGIFAIEWHTYFRYCTRFHESNLKLIGKKEVNLPSHSMVFFPGNTIHSGKRHIKA